MAKAKGGLGKGLEALFADNNTDTAAQISLALNEIEPNREQPRKVFETSALSDLADSIREYGILQPLLVRPTPEGGYQLVAGERRWRAARMAGLTQVPVIIKDLTDAETMALALIENLQREDLNPLEEAAGYRDLMDKFGLTQEQVSERVGKSRPVVTNAMRLLNLPEDVRAMLSSNQITSGHARSLLALEEEALIRQTAREIVSKGLSVRQVETLAKNRKKDKKSTTKAALRKVATAWDNSFFAEVELALTQSLGRKVKIEGEHEKGKITIEFYNTEDLRALAASLEKGTD